MLNKFSILILSLATTQVFASDALSEKLAKVHTQITIDYSNIKHLSAEHFMQLDAQSVVLFDVREDKEYQVSHIANAIRIDPDLPAEKFLTTYANLVKGKTVVFYCSVGRRSSEFVAELNMLESAGIPSESYNLTGGIFHWHNQQYPLMKSQLLTSPVSTDLVHPYNFFWSRLLENKALISYRDN